MLQKTKIVFLVIGMVCMANSFGNVSIFSDQEYQKIFSLLGQQNYSTRTEILTQMAHDFLLAREEQGQNQASSFMEIGPGDGRISSGVVELFQSVTFFEPNQEFAKNFIGKEKVTLFPRTFDPNIVRENSFNLIFAINVFYHMPMDEWDYYLKGMIRILKSRGEGIILIAKRDTDYIEMFHFLNQKVKKQFKLDLQFPSSEVIVEKIKNIDTENSLALTITDLETTKVCADTQDEIFLTLKFIFYSNYVSEKWISKLSDQDRIQIDSFIKEYQSSLPLNKQFCFEWTDQIIQFKKKS